MIIGYTSGVYDCFHYGHMRYLEACKSLCDCLIIGVDSDEIVRINKGSDRPIDNIDVRINNINNFIKAKVFEKKCTNDILLMEIMPNRYFVPNNRCLSKERKMIMQLHYIELHEVQYTEEISTTLLLMDHKKSRLTNVEPNSA